MATFERGDIENKDRFAGEWIHVEYVTPVGVTCPGNAFAHRDRVRKRTAFKHGVQFRAARKVMR